MSLSNFPKIYAALPLPVLLAWAALLGACFGSFLSVCVWRIPRGESTVRPRSHCPACNALIPWYWNIPVMSWLALRGKCGRCGARISPRYLLLELLTGALFAGVAWRFAGDFPATLLAWVVVFGLELGSFIDLDWYILPDRVTVGGMALGLAASALMPRIHGATYWADGLLASFGGLAFGFGTLWLISVAGRIAYRREALGFGDVKLMGAVGALFGWRAVLAVLFLSALAGSAAGLTLMALGRRDLQGRIPYGPFIALATLAWLFAGGGLWAWYTALLAP
ncbi:MAG: prepilin peptidase, partial [Kiritimatiellae bacterium]|nr:prepilin peptidase [Kiritimatiellia bacterium]